MALQENSNVVSDFVINKATTASFSDVAWIPCEQGSTLWVLFNIGTGVTGSFTFKGLVGSTTYPIGITFPSGLLVHSASTTGSIAISGNSLALTGYSGPFAVALEGVPYKIRPDFSFTAGGGTGSLGLQIQYFQRGT
jgi:hypothetical protein